MFFVHFSKVTPSLLRVDGIHLEQLTVEYSPQLESDLYNSNSNEPMFEACNFALEQTEMSKSLNSPSRECLQF